MRFSFCFQFSRNHLVELNTKELKLKTFGIPVWQKGKRTVRMNVLKVNS